MAIISSFSAQLYKQSLVLYYTVYIIFKNVTSLILPIFTNAIYTIIGPLPGIMRQSIILVRVYCPDYVLPYFLSSTNCKNKLMLKLGKTQDIKSTY